MELQSLPIQQRGASVADKQKERLFPSFVSALIVSISSAVMGYTFAFSSSAILELTEGVQNLPKDYRFSTILSEAFAVSYSVMNFLCIVYIELTVISIL